MSVPPGDRLMYGHNWEDAALETAALDICAEDRVIAIAGAGCTVLALLARGPRQLDAVDRSDAQLQLLQLKLGAVIGLPPGEAAGFLGGVAAEDRGGMFRSIAAQLPAATRRFWSERPEQIRRGVVAQGRVEQYFGLVRGLLGLVHSRGRIEQLFAQSGLEAQRSFYREQWDTRGWRALFLLAHKRILDRVLDPSFYQYVDARNLSRELRLRAERCMTELPVAANYFLSWILRGRYGEDARSRPDYLAAAVAPALRAHAGRLNTHAADVRAFLRTRPGASCDKFYLSNVSEWLADDELGPFFAEVARVARDGATVCYRALMVDRPRPADVDRLFVEDSARSAALAATDRAFINAGFHVVTVRKQR